MNMLTSGNQYLRPEYLSPLPTTLDAKKSPLALLAQTCSNIGADNPNNKPIIPALEKAKDPDKAKESKSSSSCSSTSSCEDKSSFKPYAEKKEEGDECHKRTPTGGSKAGSPVTGSLSPAASASCGKASPANSVESNHGKAVSSSEACRPSESATPTGAPGLSSASAPSGSQSTLSGLGYGSSLGLDLGRLDPTKDGLAAMTHLALGAYKHGSALGSLANCVGCGPGHMGAPPPSPVEAVYPSGALGSQGSGHLKGGYSPLSPYLGYARVKTASGGTTLVPVCRDPYCTNCQFSMQSAQLTACPSGCTQCNHERMPPSPLAGLGPAGMGLTGPASPAAGPPGLNSQLYPHSMLARPNVCSWMVGDTYCGKRFSSSEELLQHLRTHTNLTASDGGLSLLSPGLPPVPVSVAGPAAAAAAAAAATSAGWSAACHLHYSTAASTLGGVQGGLRRTYPTSLSPVSSLSAAARYHPYKAPVPTFPGAPLPPLPHPGLGLYYSPYGIYGQRLGPPVHP